MQIIWLRAFVKLAEHMSFSEAADEIFVSQSSLSKYIKLLEKYVNAPLLDRTTRRLHLTPAGEQLYCHAVKIVQEYDQMMGDVQALSERKKEQLHIAQVSAVNIYGYSLLFSQLCKNNPDIEFDIRELEMSAALRALRNNEVELAVVRTNLVENLSNYKEVRLNAENMLFLCNDQHPLAGREEVSLREIQQEKLVLQKFAVDEITLMFQKYHALEQGLKICVVTTRSSAIFDYVQSGLGVSVVSQSLFRRLDPDGKLRLIPIKEKPQLTLGILIKRGPLSLPSCRLINYINEERDFSGQYISLSEPE